MTAVMRGKEEAHDYRYFEEPDLAAIRVDQKWISQISQNLPEHPDKRKKRFIAMYNLPEYDALILTSERELADFFEECAKIYCGAKTLSNWIMGELMRMMNESQTQINSITVKPSSLASLLKCIDDGIISGIMAKKVFEEMFKTGREPSCIIKEEGFSQNNDVSLIRGMVLNVLAENKSSVEDIKAGREKAFGFLVGQVMKASGGRANPSIVNKILREELA
jgi:aspartyl-tRNA(Asn)/glutamyl-tRNA(Gln) amidotransferase subunit B